MCVSIFLHYCGALPDSSKSVFVTWLLLLKDNWARNGILGVEELSLKTLKKLLCWCLEGTLTWGLRFLQLRLLILHFFLLLPFPPGSSADLVMKLLDLSQALHPGLVCAQNHTGLTHWLLSAVRSVAWLTPSFPRFLQVLFHTAHSCFLDSQDLTLFAPAHSLAWPGGQTGWTCLGVTVAVWPAPVQTPPGGCSPLLSQHPNCPHSPQTSTLVRVWLTLWVSPPIQARLPSKFQGIFIIAGLFGDIPSFLRTLS